MPLYAYKATTEQGIKYTGYRFSVSEETLYASLKTEGLFLTDCQESREERFLPKLSQTFSGKFFHKIPKTLLIDFCYHMAQLDEADVTIHVAIHDLALSTSHKRFRNLLHVLHEDLRVGIPLTEALARHPTIFDRTFQKLINAAELTGNFAPQFRHLEKHLRQQETIRHQLHKSLRSPLILFCLVMIFLMMAIDFILPNMMELLTSLGLKEFPLSTKFLIWVGPILTYIPVLSLVGFGLIALSSRLPKARYYGAKHVLKIPLYKLIIVNHFWHVFAVMLKGGIDLVPSLTQAIQVIRNPYLQDRLTSLSQEIMTGVTLSEAFQKEEKLFSPFMIRLLKLSEQTGNLKELIFQAASYHQTQTLRQMETFVSWVEPSLILLMGGLLIWVVLAIIIPFYGIIGSLS